MQTVPRPRLDTSEPLFAAVADLVDRLEEGGMDLWAANLRACLRSESSGEVMEALGCELFRLRESAAARRLRVVERADELIATVEAAVGEPDHAYLPLYIAVRDLADLLRLDAHPRWVAALEDAVGADEFSDAERVARLTRALGTLQPQAAGLPSGVVDRVAAVRQRLERARDAERTRRCLSLALRRPA